MFVFLSRVFKDFSFYFFVTVLLWVLILFRRGFVTVSPQVFPAPMMHCAKRRPSFSSEKEGKTDSRGVLKISRPCAVLSVGYR